MLRLCSSTMTNTTTVSLPHQGLTSHLKNYNNSEHRYYSMLQEAAYASFVAQEYLTQYGVCTFSCVGTDLV